LKKVDKNFFGKFCNFQKIPKVNITHTYLCRRRKSDQSGHPSLHDLFYWGRFWKHKHIPELA
jgi:hypothetical protein